ncbi:acyl-CoA dehydrogenase family protein [Erythrobacter sp. SN021]|uniref:acyl-CoA dehydrogenase family protein n=1 Tax=Erythrobacter sp. SN021 TaxID=2912574 RepID=UPI001F2EDA95|nr:acyl-CoA dehydrogenase family protein [Erythrobacter sp. SN021]MCF8882067.1 acyl-CoA dehydrogenase family protein [Erythrobacter sp. SN021]
MSIYRPQSQLITHEVSNQPPPLEDFDAFALDQPLRDALDRTSAKKHGSRLSAFGKKVGSAEVIEWGRLANENPPQSRVFDRFGHRIDQVEFHPAYHELMRLGLEGGVSAAAWKEAEGGHALHAALLYLMTQADAGTVCPMSMTYAVVPALRVEPTIANEWEPRVTRCRYDPRVIPVGDKEGATMGMAMTEKQGGSDVRANTTRARCVGEGEYELTGHKWFCSAPMSDAFLTLAYAEGGLTCFLVPRWRPDGSRNAIHIMRLKDKLGDRSNASSEIEYHGALAQRVGDEGRGVRTIIEMVQGTRLDCIAGSAAGMRAALVQAIWHTRHRSAFQRRLSDQPAMQAVLSDLALEAEGACALTMRIASAFDAAAKGDEKEAAFARLATPIAKYWVCKRQPGFVHEALECLGGAGYVEEGPMPRLFRQSPLNAIWEGSGNVIALDVLRALGREPDGWEAFRGELVQASGAHALLDTTIERLDTLLAEGLPKEADARRFVEMAALALEAVCLRHAPPAVFDGFCAVRLDPAARAFAYGGSGVGLDHHTILLRALPTT